MFTFSLLPRYLGRNRPPAFSCFWDSQPQRVMNHTQEGCRDHKQYRLHQQRSDLTNSISEKQTAFVQQAPSEVTIRIVHPSSHKFRNTYSTCRRLSMAWKPRIKFKAPHNRLSTNETIPGRVTGSRRWWGAAKQKIRKRHQRSKHCL